MRFQLRSLIVLLLLVITQKVSAQAVPDTSLNTVISDSLSQKRRAELATRTELAPPRDTAAVKGPFQPNPKKSALYSAILPGMGQLYNRQYWKVPIIYVGIGAAGYFLIDNTNQYQKYRKAYIARINNPSYQDEFTGLWSTDINQTMTNLKTLQDAYKKFLDLTVLLTGLGYTLQVIDALAFAHLKNFDVSRNISLRLQPVAAPNGAGLGLVMHFK